MRRRVDCTVIFYGSMLGGFWSFLCAPGWRHCLLIMTILDAPARGVFARKFSLLVNPSGWGLHLDVLWKPPDEIVAEFIEAGVSAVVRQTIDLPPKKLFALRGVFSCVSILKAAMGINNWRIITPYGLFRCMVSSGGEVIFRSGEDGTIYGALGETDRVGSEATGGGAGPGIAGSAEPAGPPAGGTGSARRA